MAVQHLGASSLAVHLGQVLPVLAAHDTYSLSFRMLPQDSSKVAAATGGRSEDTEGGEKGRGGDLQEGSGDEVSPPVVPAAGDEVSPPFPVAGEGPQGDPQWLAEHSVAQSLAAQITRACAQDPTSFRHLATAALALAARPQEGLQVSAWEQPWESPACEQLVVLVSR